MTTPPDLVHDNNYHNSFIITHLADADMIISWVGAHAMRGLSGRDRNQFMLMSRSKPAEESRSPINTEIRVPLWNQKKRKKTTIQWTQSVIGDGVNGESAYVERRILNVYGVHVVS